MYMSTFSQVFWVALQEQCNVHINLDKFKNMLTLLCMHKIAWMLTEMIRYNKALTLSYDTFY